jgi:hypothetical protein
LDEEMKYCLLLIVIALTACTTTSTNNTSKTQRYSAAQLLSEKNQRPNEFILGAVSDNSLSIMPMSKFSDRQLLKVLDPTVDFFMNSFVQKNVGRYRKIISSVYRNGRSTAAEQALIIGFNNRMPANNITVLCSPRLCSVVALENDILLMENVEFDKKSDCKDFHISMISCTVNGIVKAEINQKVSAYEASVILQSGDFSNDQEVVENYQFMEVNNNEGILRKKVEQYVLAEISKQQITTMREMALRNLKCKSTSCNLVVENSYYDDVNEFESIELRIVHDVSGKEILRVPALPDFPLWARVKKHDVHYEIGDWPVGHKSLLDLSRYCKGAGIYLSDQRGKDGIAYHKHHFQCQIGL